MELSVASQQYSAEDDASTSKVSEDPFSSELSKYESMFEYPTPKELPKFREYCERKGIVATKL